MRTRPFLCVVFFLSLPSFPLLAEGPAGLRVRSIHILRKDIFDRDQPGENKLLYRAINRLHATTKVSTIKKEMLLHEGDLFNPGLARESERALRTVLKLRQVRVTPSPVDEHTVDLMVEVHETWTTEPTLSLEGAGSDKRYKAGLRERNFLGYGKSASFFYKKDTGVVRRAFSYDDPNMLRTRLSLNFNYEEGDNTINRAVGLKRPFYSTLTPWTWDVSTLNNTEEIRLYKNGDEVAKMQANDRRSAVHFDRAFRPSTRLIRRLGLGYLYEREVLEDRAARATVSDRLHHYVSLRGRYERVNYLTTDHIKQYDRQEDIELGPSLLMEAGVDNKWLRNSSRGLTHSATAFAGKKLGTAHYALLTVAGEGRREGTQWRDVRTRADVEYYLHFTAHQTLALHAQYERVRQPDADSQVLLGGDSGLRGYQFNQFSGDKLTLFNVENRLFLRDDFLKLMGIGAVVFYDMGRVWEHGEKARWKGLRSDAGAGLRFHLSRTSLGHVLRLDWAYALNPLPGEDHWVITFGSRQAF